MLHDPARHVTDALGRLERALLARDVAAAVDCFVPDGALFGGGLGEDAHGHDDLARVFDTLVDRGLCPEWELEDPWTQHEGECLSFVADATVVIGVLGRRTRRRRLRLSGSLRGTRSDGRYRFELFNGLGPLVGPVLGTVDVVG